MKPAHAIHRILAAGLVLLSGCVVHMPMSETVMFRDPATPIPHAGSIGFGAMATFAAQGGLLRAWRDRDYPTLTSNAPTGPALAVGGLYLAYYGKQGRGAISLFAGTSAGVDMTAKLGGRNYLTVGYTLGDFLQGYVQHRAFNSPQIAAVVGAGARTEFLALDDACESIWGCGPQKRVYSVGLRGIGLFRFKGSTNTGFKLATYVGYVPYVRYPTMTVSVSAGLF